MVKTGFRIFLGFAVILATGFYFLLYWITNDVQIQPKKSMEEPLVDIAHILAVSIEKDIKESRINTDSLRGIFDKVEKRRFAARIYELNKSRVTLGVYVTDKQGIVLFDSTNGKNEGKDFSDWNDVKYTLRNKYGVRTTRKKSNDPVSSVAYIAAPIWYNGEIVGVCSVSKAWKSINKFIDTTQQKIIAAAIISFVSVLILSFFISRWITSPIRRLTKYADAISEGKRDPLPKLGAGEIRKLGESFENMVESLEGKKYIEKYIQTLTHQLKGPLSAIRGAAELLQEDLPEHDRKRFISNIESESNRLQRIVERVLELSAIEQQRELRNVETLDLSKLVKEIVDGLTIVLKNKEIVVLLKVEGNFCFKGERFLIQQAIYNLLNNAIEFSFPGGIISIEITEQWKRLFLVIRDNGAGIPDYALDKVFEKFYSLQRPDTGKKSSGLGLSLVKEVAELHKGTIQLKKNKPTGVVAILKIPVGL